MQYKILIIFLYYFINVQLIVANKIVQDYSEDLCLIPCPKIMDPVCATDGNIFKLFNSPCLLLQHSCESRKDWIPIELDSCIIEDDLPEGRSLCERPCPFIYLPVCAHNGKESKTFPNECIMEVENCSLDENEKFTISKFADCVNVVPA